jgi:histidinol-phosphate aminotransferase
VPGAIKLASNETPYPPLPHVLEQLATSALELNRYPDNFSAELAERLGVKFGLSAAQVAVGCGSVSLCTQLAQSALDAGDEFVYAWRSFEAYPIIAAVAGAVSVQVPLLDHVHDLDAMLARITSKTRLIVVCNPNNPTGTAVRADALRRFVDHVPADVLVVLDEAYREFVSDQDVPDGATLLADYPNLVVLRTFSKAYGLAGLRVGFALCADAAVAVALRQTQVPFAVTQLAQDAALASLEAPAEQQLAERVSSLVAERIRVAQQLRAIGYEVPDSQANFVWLPLGDATTAWAQGCADRKLIVRPFAGAGVRITVSTAQENDLLLEAAADLYV